MIYYFTPIFSEYDILMKDFITSLLFRLLPQLISKNRPFLQAAQAASILNTLDMLALAPRNLEARALEALQNVFIALQQLRTSFSTIIMPEGLKSFLQEEASVMEVGQKVEAIVRTCGATLEEVRHETMLHTRCVMLGMDSPHQATIETVLEMRRLFQEQVGRFKLILGIYFVSGGDSKRC